MEETFKKLKQIPMPDAWNRYVLGIQYLRADPDFSKLSIEAYLEKLNEIAQESGYTGREEITEEHNKYIKGY